MAANISHLNSLFSIVLLHNILIFIMLSTSSLMRYQTFADFRRHCAMREGGGGGKKGIRRTVLFKCCPSHPADTFRPHEDGHYIWFASNYSYFSQAPHQVPVQCPSFFSPSKFRSSNLYRISSCITLPVSPSLHIGEARLNSTY